MIDIKFSIQVTSTVLLATFTYTNPVLAMSATIKSQAALVRSLYEQSKANKHLLNCRNDQNKEERFAWIAGAYPGLTIELVQTDEILASGVPRFLSQAAALEWGRDKNTYPNDPNYGRGQRTILKKEDRVIEFYDTRLPTTPGGKATETDYYLYGQSDNGSYNPAVISIKTSPDLKRVQEMTFQVFIVERKQDGDLAHPKFNYLWKVHQSLVCRF